MSVDTRSLTEGGALSEAALRELSASTGEPSWMLDRRMEAWKAFERMGMPTKSDEEWRRTDLSLLNLSAISSVRAEVGAEPGSFSELPEPVRTLLGEKRQEGGLLVRTDSGVSHTSIVRDAVTDGVLFNDMDSAVRDHPDLVRRYFGGLVAPSEGKLIALHYALWSGGAFVVVPRHVQVALPLETLSWSDTRGHAVMPHTVVVLEEGAELFLVEQLASPDDRGPAMANAVVELYLAQGSRLEYVSLQRWGRSVFHLGIQRALVGRDAQLGTTSVVLGSRVTKSWIESRLTEPGANVAMRGIMFADGEQRFHHHTLQDHQAPSTSSDLLFKVALADRSRSEFSGLIRVHPDAQKTDAYQANRNLSLSDAARADSMPKLEIAANDVRCTHGATVGPIDQDQLFYLMARGLPRRAAERMIVQGFFEPLIEKIPLATARERVREAVDAKLGG